MAALPSLLRGRGSGCCCCCFFSGPTPGACGRSFRESTMWQSLRWGSLRRRDAVASDSARVDASLVREARAGAGLAVGAAAAAAAAAAMAAFPHHAAAAEVASGLDAWSALVASEPKNALSLPTWIIHVASVAEWITAMALVWRYGDTPGKSTWKGLSWGMVPLLGGAMCACTWHFFYNAQSLEILVVLQAALTVIGNFTMWVAAFRIYQSSQKQSKSS